MSCNNHHHEHQHECCQGHKHHHNGSCGCGCHEHKHHHECNNNEHHHSDSCACGCVHEHKKNYFTLLLIRTTVSIILIFVSTFLEGFIKNIILSLSYLIIAYDVLYNAFKNIVKGKAFDENFLMSIASLTALVVPFFTTKAHIDQYDGILVVILYQIGEFIQHKAVDKSKKSITDMLDIDVETVSILVGEEIKEVLVENIKVDDILIIKPGDLIVVDGIIVSGSSSLNTSALTGESVPKDVYVGDVVLSGMINNDGLLHVKATTTHQTSTTAKVKEIVEKANQNKAKLDRFFTRFAKIYTPVVIGISIFIMFVIPLILGFEEHFLPYLYKGLAVMVISCPCALVISIPLSYFMGIGKAAKSQILVKGASYLEILSDIDAILFDKTGTLTKGEFVVTDVYSINPELMNNLLYSAEKNFTHAIAKSITKHFNNANELEIDDLLNIPGYGVKAKYLEKEVLIGNFKLLSENGIDVKKIAVDSTVIYVSYNHEFLGYLIIEDELKDDALSTIKELTNSYDLYIISGDKKETVRKIANVLNIKKYHYELLPDEKLKIVDEIKKGKKLIYVGDGINDAACLISSTVGIAMRSIGSDIAINASDIVLMDDKLENITKAIKISKKTRSVVFQNIVFSLLIKVLVMILAIMFGVPMYLAIIADVGVAMLAVLNTFRIMYHRI